MPEGWASAGASSPERTGCTRNRQNAMPKPIPTNIITTPFLFRGSFLTSQYQRGTPIRDPDDLDGHQPPVAIREDDPSPDSLVVHPPQDAENSDVLAIGCSVLERDARGRLQSSCASAVLSSLGLGYRCESSPGLMRCRSIHRSSELL